METEGDYDVKTLESMNEKAISNTFFTPDKIYVDLSLLKDFPIGLMYKDLVDKDPTGKSFVEVQQKLIPLVERYQNRLYDTVDDYLGQFGYTDQKLESLAQTIGGDDVLLWSPVTKFMNLLIRHLYRNQNNSRPANKYIKTKIDNDHYFMKPVEVTYYINTHPLTLSHSFSGQIAATLGESLGSNICFLNKDPILFDQGDWDGWMKDIDCFYLNSLGRFTRGDFCRDKQGSMQFVGVYFFARKRFEKCVMDQMVGQDFEDQISRTTAQLDMFCDFAWIGNDDLCLVEKGTVDG